MTMISKYFTITLCALSTLFLTGCLQQGDSKFTQYHYLAVSVNEVPNTKTINDLKDSVGLKPQLIGFSTAWQWPFPSESVKSLLNKQVLSIVTWDLASYDENPIIFTESILGGDWDEYIDEWLSAARDLKYTVIIDIQHSRGSQDNKLRRYFKKHASKLGCDNIIWYDQLKSTTLAKLNQQPSLIDITVVQHDGSELSAEQISRFGGKAEGLVKNALDDQY